MKKILVLTDHSHHSRENSLYALLQSLYKFPGVGQVDVASRGCRSNAAFFAGEDTSRVATITVGDQWSFDWAQEAWQGEMVFRSASTYDYVWLRLPGPYTMEKIEVLERAFPRIPMIHPPRSIRETGSKDFLLHFAELCPPMRICRTTSDIEEFASQMPIVLKPFREYGGLGLIRIEGKKVWVQDESISLEEWFSRLVGQKIEYLAMQFMKNIHLGDKRIIVVRGEILGTSLRTPALGGWLCNISQGGSSSQSSIAPEEYEIVRTVDPVLRSRGILMYGLDTLVNDEGMRVLSEINTASIGGLAQIEEQSQFPVVNRAIELMWGPLL